MPNAAVGTPLVCCLRSNYILVSELLERICLVEIILTFARFLLLNFIFALCLNAHTAAAFTLNGEVYSESTYVPQYGILTESQIRLIPFKTQNLTTFVGVASQIQNKTKTSQDDLYEENLIMATVGVRYSLHPMISLLAEFRTEDRTRFGILAGNIWLYDVATQRVFTEFYGESLILPSYHNDPVSTLWVKQGLRYEPSEKLYLDPFVEGYTRNSPTPDLGRDTNQLRVGLRTLKVIDSWMVSLLVYQSFVQDETPHEEALFVFGGSF